MAVFLWSVYFSHHSLFTYYCTMCGIAGIVSKHQEISLPAKYLSNALNKIKHRGPDGEGFLLVNEKNNIECSGNDTPEETKKIFQLTDVRSLNETYRLQLGHRRLSVIDTSAAGHQPMSVAEKKIWITYNGEIYNYKELRESLKQKGYIFLTQTDTEVILNAYLEFGEHCVNHFNGMWSFVIYDSKKNILFGSRDRFGVKPFYYFKNEDHFVFGSEQKIFSEFPFSKNEINRRAAFDFFVLGKLELEDEGLFKNIYELLPSHSFTLNLSTWKFETKKYYSLNVNNSFALPDKNAEEEIIKMISEKVTWAISLRLRSDVNVGTCLSGGIDSSVIACTVNELLKQHEADSIGEKQKLFTASFPNQSFDETAFAKEVADKTLSSWFTIEPNKNNFGSEIETLMNAHDLPIFSTSSYAQFNVMKLAASNNVKVVLDGQGADELFAGYKQYFFTHIHELKKNSAKSFWGKELVDFTNDENDQKFLSRHSSKVHLRKYFKTLGQFELKYVNSDLVHEFKERMELLRPTFYKNLNDELAADFTNGNLKELLRREDRNGMHFSIEARTPFADDVDLINYVFSIPSSLKIQHGTMKYLFREAFKKSLPEKIYSRRDKKGFSTPNNQWLDSMKENFRNYISSDMNDFVNTKKLLRDYDKFFSIGNKLESFRQMKFISFGVWQKIFI